MKHDFNHVDNEHLARKFGLIDHELEWFKTDITALQEKETSCCLEYGFITGKVTLFSEEEKEMSKTETWSLLKRFEDHCFSFYTHLKGNERMIELKQSNKIGKAETVSAFPHCRQ